MESVTVFVVYSSGGQGWPRSFNPTDGSMLKPIPILATLLILLAACGGQVMRDTGQVTRNAPRILAMGDSMMAWHSVSGRSIADALARELGEPVANNAVSGARIVYPLPLTGAMGMRIRNQYEPGDWDWVVLNGGGNDLWLGCGCNRCDKRMDRMISADGRRGEIPHLVWTLRETGAQIVYLGYLRSPGRGSIIEHCRDEGDELERRIGRLSALLDGVHFLPVADMVPEGDRSYHALDMIHPSLKASSEIGGKVADLIRAATPDSQVRVRRPGSEPASGTVRHGLRP